MTDELADWTLVDGRERVCRDCHEQVSVRWTWDANPVFWTCPEHGIRDQSQVETVHEDRVGEDPETLMGVVADE